MTASDSPKPKAPIWRRWWAIAAYVVVLLVIVGNLLPDDEPVAAPSAAQPSSAAQSSSEPADQPEDVTDDVKAAVGDDAAVVTSATLDSNGIMRVETTIMDPREDDSAEAAQAVAICEAVMGELAPNGLSVLDADETAFAAWMERAPAGYESKACFEY